MTPYQIAAYFPEWEVRRPYYVRHMDAVGSAAKITLINYAFGFPGPDPATGEIVCQMRDAHAAYRQIYTAEMSVDGVGDAPDQPLRGHFNQLRKLKAKYPHLKVVVSLGGWTDSVWFSDAARTPQAREKFAASCIDLYIHGNLPEQDGAGGRGAGAGVFDGIDIDWEYPIASGLEGNHYHPDDDKNFVLLLQEFRRQYQAIGRPDLLLTAAVPGPAQAGQYRMEEAHSLLDLVAVMTYDLRGDWSPITGHHTNLFASDFDPAPPEQRLSADGTLRLYRDRFGVPAHKLLIGAAFYGRAWREVPPANNGLFQSGKPAHLGGNNYRDLLVKMRHGYRRFWDDSAQAPWLYNESEGIFYTFDDPESIAQKARYVKANGMGGVMFWEISGDDDQGTLVDTIYNNLR